MKLLIFTLCSALSVSGLARAASAKSQPVPRTAFLGQIPKTMLDSKGHLSFEEVAKAYAQAGRDVHPEDFEAYSSYKFRLTPDAQKQVGDSDGDLIYPIFPQGGLENAPKLMNACLTVNVLGDGHESYAFRFPEYDFVFSGGWIPGSGVGSSLETSRELMIGSSVPNEGYEIDIPQNTAGLYDDYPAPLSVVYRRTSSNLIGAFRHKNGDIDGFKVCFSQYKAVCHMRAVVKSRYDEPPATFTTVLNLIMAAENQTDVKSQILAKAKRDLGCLVGGNQSIDDYVKDECRGGTKSAACENAKNACAAYVKAKNEMQCGADLSRMNFYAFDQKNNRWLPVTSN